MSLIKRIQDWDSLRRQAANRAIMEDFTVEAAERYVKWHDHGFLRRYWTNLDEIAPGVFRSNYPSGRRFADLKARGIKTIINLRGGTGTVPYVLEQTYCAENDIAFHSVFLDARRASPAKEFLTLLDLFDSVDKPFLMHCKSGADRAGLASALYLMHVEGQSYKDATRMLSLKYLHVSDRKTGIMGHILKSCAQDIEEKGISIRDWFQDVYNPQEVQKDFDLSRQK